MIQTPVQQIHQHVLTVQPTLILQVLDQTVARIALMVRRPQRDLLLVLGAFLPPLLHFMLPHPQLYNLILEFHQRSIRLLPSSRHLLLSILLLHLSHHHQRLLLGAIRDNTILVSTVLHVLQGSFNLILGTLVRLVLFVMQVPMSLQPEEPVVMNAVQGLILIQGQDLVLRVLRASILLHQEQQVLMHALTVLLILIQTLQLRHVLPVMREVPVQLVQVHVLFLLHHSLILPP